MLTELILVLVVACSTCVADITGTSPDIGTCLCSIGSLNIRATACGSDLGSVESGRCFRYTGSKEACSITDVRYEYFRLDYEGNDGWAAGEFLEESSDNAACDQTGESLDWSDFDADTPVSYTCDVEHEGKRIHETMSHTPFDCQDSACHNTCKGGQCVAYVTCNCKRDGKWAPGTNCWRPGTKVVGSDGKCNRKIPLRTAIATFNSAGRYFAGHAAVYMGCVNDHTIKIYDQYCSKSVGYSNIPSTNHHYKYFAVITNPDVSLCPDRVNYTCRVENSGPTSCPSSNKCG